MAKGKGLRPYSYRNFERKLDPIKYTLICLVIIVLAIGISVLAISLWLLLDHDIKEWITLMEIEEFYIGVYILLIASLVSIVVTGIGIYAAFSQHDLMLNVFIGLQVLCFLLCFIGSGVLLAYGTRDSNLQPLMRTKIQRLMMESYNPASVEALRIIQETIGCCGADGPNDYIVFKKPLPSECRDTVTGSAFQYGCVEEFTLFLESKAAWLSGLAITIGALQVTNIVLALIMKRLLSKIDETKEFGETTPFTPHPRT